VLPGSVPDTTAVELPSDRAAVLVVVADGRVSADADERLICDREEVPPVCLGEMPLGIKSSPFVCDEVVLAKPRAPKSLLARLALVEGVSEVVESCVRLS